MFRGNGCQSKASGKLLKKLLIQKHQSLLINTCYTGFSYLKQIIMTRLKTIPIFYLSNRYVLRDYLGSDPNSASTTVRLCSHYLTFPCLKFLHKMGSKTVLASWGYYGDETPCLAHTECLVLAIIALLMQIYHHQAIHLLVEVKGFYPALHVYPLDNGRTYVNQRQGWPQRPSVKERTHDHKLVRSTLQQPWQQAPLSGSRCSHRGPGRCLGHPVPHFSNHLFSDSDPHQAPSSQKAGTVSVISVVSVLHDASSTVGLPSAVIPWTEAGKLFTTSFKQGLDELSELSLRLVSDNLERHTVYSRTGSDKEVILPLPVQVWDRTAERQGPGKSRNLFSSFLCSSRREQCALGDIYPMPRHAADFTMKAKC